MSGFSVPPKPQPGSHESAPWDFSTFLQKTADQREVTLGPGGTAVVVPKDTLFAPPPSQEGIGGAQSKVSVKTSDPKLDEPAFAGLGLWSMQFATTIVNILIGTMKEQPLDTLSGPSLGESILTTLAYREEALRQALIEEGLISPETILGEYTFGENTAIGEREGVEERQVDIYETSANAAFFAWLETMAVAVSAGLPSLSFETQALLNDIRSDDIGTIKQRLIDMANLSSLDLSPTQEALFISKLEVIATGIAGANEEGGALVLNLTVPGLMIPVFMETVDMSTDTSMTADDKSKLSLALLNICTSLASANFQKATSLQTPSPEFLALVSGDRQQVGMLLSTIASTMTLPSGVTNKDLIGTIDALTSFLCALNPEQMETLQSVDQEALTELFSQGLDAAQAAGIISAEVKAQLLTTLVPILADQTASINHVKLIGDLSAKDPATIEKSLTFLTKVSSDKSLNTPTRQIAMTYIQALISALVYLANIRCLMVRMESEFTQELAEAKIAGIENELQIAQKTYTTSLQKVMISYEKNVNAIAKAKLWRVLGPLLSILLAVIMVAVCVALIVATVASGGAAAPGFLAVIAAGKGLVALVAATITSTVVLVVVVADAACQWAKGTGMWKMVCEAMGVTNDMAISAISMAFEILLNLVVIIVSAGTYAAVIAIKTVAKTAVQLTIKAVVSQILTTMAKTFAKLFTTMGARAIVQQSMTIAMNCLLSSGLLTKALTALGKVLYKDDSKANTFALVMTLVCMFMLAFAISKVGPKGGAAAATAAKPKAPAAATKSFGTAIAQAARTAGAALSKIPTKITTAIKQFLKYMKEVMEDIGKATQKYLISLKKFPSSLAKVGKSLFQRVDPAKVAIIQKNAKNAQETAQREANKWVKAVADTSRSQATATVIGEARMLTGLAGGLQSLRATLLTIGKGFKNLVLNILDHYEELLAVGKFGKGLTGMEKLINRLLFVTEQLRLTRFALQITAAAMQYEAAKKEEYFHRLLSVLAEDQAMLQAVSQMFMRLGGIDQTETITKITESAQESFENWTRLLQLVSDFIKDAGMRVSEMSTRAGM